MERHEAGDARLFLFPRVLIPESMPELPEVEVTRQKLLPLIRGRRVLAFWTDWPRGLRVAKSKEQMATSMRGRKILDITRRGKVLFFKLSGRPERELAVHLRMSGRIEFVPARRLFWRSPKYATPDRESRWVHVRWRLSGNRELRFIDPRKFGLVWYGDPALLATDPYLGRLGRDAKSLDRDEFLDILRRSRGMIKPLLLRQDRIAGIGNIIADESLFRARIHPRAAIAALAPHDLRRLHRAIRGTLGRMLAAGGTSLRDWAMPDGRRGRFQERRQVYGRAGAPCPRCRTTLARIVVGGRGTTMCPRCQQTKNFKL